MVLVKSTLQYRIVGNDLMRSLPLVPAKLRGSDVIDGSAEKQMPQVYRKYDYPIQKRVDRTLLGTVLEDAGREG